MRKLKRLIAKHNMRLAGVHKPNRKIGGESWFSKHWREYFK